MKYKVLAGTLRFEDGTFQHGEVFEVSEDRAKLFSINDVAPFFDSRPMILAVKQVCGTELLCGAEIGVCEGVHAQNILQTLNMGTLHLIDPYLPYVDDLERKKDFSAGKTKAFTTLEEYSNQIEWHFKPSSEAAVDLTGECLDFVYIDGNHSYDSVKADIEAYLPKVKAGGFLGGHDYCIDETPGVVQAVDEFIKSSGYVLHQGMTDWWIQK